MNAKRRVTTSRSASQGGETSPSRVLHHVQLREHLQINPMLGSGVVSMPGLGNLSGAPHNPALFEPRDLRNT
jgi:hypothetical protein